MDREQRARRAYDQDVQAARSRSRSRSPEKKGHMHHVHTVNIRVAPTDHGSEVRTPALQMTRGEELPFVPRQEEEYGAPVVTNEPSAIHFRQAQTETKRLAEKVMNTLPMPFHAATGSDELGDERGDEYFMSNTSGHGIPPMPAFVVNSLRTTKPALRSPIDLPMPGSPKKKFPGRGLPRTPSPVKEISPEKESLAERRHKATPAKIDIDKTRVHLKRSAERKGPQKTIIVQVPPPEPTPVVEECKTTIEQPHRGTQDPNGCGDGNGDGIDDEHDYDDDDDDEFTSSVYSLEYMNELKTARVSPLKITKAPVGEKAPVSVLQNYTEWRNMPMETKAGPGPSTATSHRRGRSEVVKTATLAPPVDHHEPAYSPLTPFFQTRDGPAQRKRAKTLVGDNGWLEKTDKNSKKDDKEKEKEKPEKNNNNNKKTDKSNNNNNLSSPTRKKGWVESLVQKARAKMGDMSSLSGGDKASSSFSSSSSQQPKKTLARDLAISLTPREQSLVYCELEYVLTTGLSAYIQGQLNAGRLDADKLRRVADGWAARGQPRVRGFRYDLETQLDLVRLHVHDFMFYAGPDDVSTSTASAAASILGVIDMMKVDARAMRVRTFCSPDTVLAKQLVDAQALFTLIGTDEALRYQINEMVAFFTAAVSRERHLGRRHDGVVVAEESSGEKTKKKKQQQHPQLETATATAAAAGIQDAQHHKSVSHSRSQTGTFSTAGAHAHAHAHAGTVAAPPLRTQRSNGLARWNTDNPRARAHVAVSQDRMDPADFDSSADEY